jgi:peroxiredoxin
MLAGIGLIAPPFALNDQDGQNASPLEDLVMGYPVVLAFDPASGDSAGLLATLATLHRRLDGLRATIFQIRAVAANKALHDAERPPFQLLSDPEGKVSAAYGIDAAMAENGAVAFVLDPNGRVALGCAPGAGQTDAILAYLRAAEAARPTGLLGEHPPVLVVPMALDPEDCKWLIEVWHRPVRTWNTEGKFSAGYDVEKGDFKVRNDSYGRVLQYVVRDPATARRIDETMLRRVGPQMIKAFGYRPTQREEYRIACYDSIEGGNLPAHRDNPTAESQHRRFTVSVMLNNESFEGGELTFREFGAQRYRVRTGTAIVWSCSLLHEVLPVTSGRRFILGTHVFG